MRRGTLSRILLVSGATLGVATTLAWMAHFDPTPLSPPIITIALYKLAYIAAGGMFVAGALAGRWANRSRLRATVVESPDAPSDLPRELPRGTAMEHLMLERLKHSVPVELDD